MKCPRCSSENLERYRQPKSLPDLIVRRHRCRDCSWTFMTVQMVVSAALAESMLIAFES